MALGALLGPGPARAATYVEYTLQGPGTIVNATQAPYPGTFIYGDPTYQQLFLSFVVDIDQYPTSTSGGLVPYGYSSVTASPVALGLAASGGDQYSHSSIAFTATVMFAGSGSTFPMSPIPTNAAGTFSITEYSGIGYLSATFLTASVTRVVTTPVPTYMHYTFGTLAVPEPASWATMILGLGAVGGAMRGRRRTPERTAAG